MPSPGERLRRARAQQSRALPDLARETCLLARYLEALENDDRRVLPGQFFHRNYAKQYARALGIDPDLCAREVDELYPAETPAPVPPPANRYRWTSPLAIAVLCVVAFAAGSGVLLLRNGRSGTPSAIAAVPAKALDVEATPTLEARRPALKLAALEATWVSVSANGRTLFRGTLLPAETRHFEGVDHARIIAGNAAGLDVEWQGKSIGPLGPRGHVRTMLLTPERYEIIPPSPRM